MVVNVTDASFDNDVLNSEIPVLVDFWAPWCGPCRMIAPVVEEMSKKYEGKLKVAKLNTDENNYVPANFSVTGIPCLIFFKGGKEVDRVVGFGPKEFLERKILAVIG